MRVMAISPTFGGNAAAARETGMPGRSAQKPIEGTVTRPGNAWYYVTGAIQADPDQQSGAPAEASAADTTASEGNAPVITATTSLIAVVFGLTMAARRPNR
jgi:hypothetical protein